MLSVIIPALNEERFLSRCLESLKDQDYAGEYEIIVVDNGSSDRTPEIARNLGVNVISCPCRGVVFARDAGFKASKGGIIVQADADTVYPGDWLSRIVAHFSLNPDAMSVCGDVVYIHSPLWARVLQSARRLINLLSLRLSRKPALCPASSLAFRREALLKAGGYNTGMPFIGDERDLQGRLDRVGRMIYDPRLLSTTSARRFQGRFYQFIFVDMLWGTLLEQAWYGVTGRSLSRSRASPRAEHVVKPLYRRGWAWSTVSMAAILGILLWGYFYPAADVFGTTYHRVSATDKLIALTFDDGPDALHTPQVLDVLHSHGVKATFFVVGSEVERNPALIRRITAEGHVLGNHSYTHRQFAEFGIPDYSELDLAQDKIEEVAGVRPRLFRPPYGRKTPWELDYVKDKGMVTVTWSLWANDLDDIPADAIEKKVIEDARPGIIIVLHDGNAAEENLGQFQTVVALPRIIEALQARGYAFVTVPELLGLPPYIERVPADAD